MRLHKQGLILSAALTLAGCASQPQLYYWENYQPTVYQYYQQDRGDVQEQIIALQKVIETSRAKDLSVPPGLYAHMGLLYSSVGNIEEAYNQFRMEKQLFPESAPFMDFLLSQSKGGAK